MPWKNQSGGGGPWGTGGGGSGGGGGQGPWGGGGRPPDLEEMLRKGQDRVKRLLPGGFGRGRALVFILLVGFVLWLLTGFYRVEPDEQGIALVFGRVWKQTGPGLNYNLPSPIGEVFTPKVTQIKRVEVGFRSSSDNDSSNSTQDVPEESLMLTGDKRIIDMQFTVFWAIKNPILYQFAIAEQEDTVKSVAEAAMREIIGRSDFEFLRTKGQAQTEQEALALVQQLLNDYHSGIEVSQVAVKNIAPPAETLAAFRDVAAASLDANTSVNEAQAYYNQVTNNANGQAQKILKDAEAYKSQRVAIATGEAKRFEEVLEAYQKAPEVTRRRLYLEAMEQVLKGMNKILIDPRMSGSGTVPYLSLNELLKNGSSSTAASPPAAGTTGGSQ
jgi:modulator of FtsH protease HflK